MATPRGQLRCGQGSVASIGVSCRRVNFYPMTAYLWSCLLTVPVKNYEIRLLAGHMATNTVTCGLVVQLWEHSGLRFMTTQTTL